MNAFSLDLSDFVFVWWGLLYEAIPFVALGALISGIVERCVSREAIARLFPRTRLLGLVGSAFLGLVFPICECGVIPVVRRLLLKGVPVSCGVVYLLASPILNPLVFASTAIAFRSRGDWTVAALRFGIGFVVAVLVGVAVWKLLGEHRVLLPRITPKPEPAPPPPSCGCECGCDPQPGPYGTAPARRASPLRVAREILQIAGADFLMIGATLAFGAAIAALINSGFSRAALEHFAATPLSAILGMMALAVMLNLCSEADAFVAASFYAFPIEAKLAFLVLGPMLDIKLLLMYATVFRPRAILAISTTVALLVLALTWSGTLWIPAIAPALAR